MSKNVEPYFTKGSIIKDKSTKRYYQVVSMLGSGAFAQCYLCKHHETKCAVKVIDFTKIESKKILDKIETERIIHKDLDHPNIVKMESDFKDDRFVYLVLEYCPNGGLDELSKRRKFTETEVKNWIKQLVNALKYMHEEKKVVHRDLKLGNLFLDHNFNIKVGDFGLSAHIIENQKKRTVCGTPNYIAPEVIFDRAYGHSYAVDIWAIGVIMYTLLVGVPPFQKSTVKEIYEKIKNTTFEFPTKYEHSRYSKDLIRDLLTRDPESRPKLDDILSHKFFTRGMNTIESMIYHLKEERYIEKRLDIDYVIFTLPITRFKAIGYILASGSRGLFYHDNTNIVKKAEGNYLHLYKINENGKPLVKKEEFPPTHIPDYLMFKREQLDYFIDYYCKASVIMPIPQTYVIKIKKIKDGSVMCLYNGVVQFDFNDECRVVIANEGREVYCFNSHGEISLDAFLKSRCLDILYQVR
ncbi:PLK protein kinase [Edhazardia aedis USNM 41457]|uniref:PLK protein kinase n=1 Tax=Edhazardia aedis (strain USNM 41457) TaxID=1003232 RepID=J9DP47_EDHAE|nr:PLK protein kinase [Edhazardia aedis USNM 41457]|eukprot:EJW03107.1 PLK protein kinase [Edhazardia aedis USNM 41457]